MCEIYVWGSSKTFLCVSLTNLKLWNIPFTIRFNLKNTAFFVRLFFLSCAVNDMWQSLQMHSGESNDHRMCFSWANKLGKEKMPAVKQICHIFSPAQKLLLSLSWLSEGAFCPTKISCHIVGGGIQSRYSAIANPNLTAEPSSSFVSLHVPHPSSFLFLPPQFSCSR